MYRVISTPTETVDGAVVPKGVRRLMDEGKVKGFSAIYNDDHSKALVVLYHPEADPPKPADASDGRPVETTLKELGIKIARPRVHVCGEGVGVQNGGRSNARRPIFR